MLLNLSYEIPSFMDAVGLKVSGVIGYSEDGWLVWWYQYESLGLLMLSWVCIQPRDNNVCYCLFLHFLHFEYCALGRYPILPLIPSQHPLIYNTFFVFEVDNFYLVVISCFLYYEAIYTTPERLR